MTEKNPFRQTVGHLFSQWTGLQLAIEHGMGGPHARAKEEWMADAVEAFFLNNANLDTSEVEDFIADIMDNEFDTLIEDGSSQDLAEKLCQYFNRYQKGEDVTSDWKQPEKSEQSFETTTLTSRLQDMTLDETDEWTVVTHKKHK